MPELAGISFRENLVEIADYLMTTHPLDDEMQ